MFTVKLLTMRWVCSGDLSDFARRCRSSEAPVLSRPVETDPLGVQRMCADPEQAWMPSCPFPGDQGHIYRDLQRTALEHNERAPHGSPNQMGLIVGEVGGVGLFTPAGRELVITATVWPKCSFITRLMFHITPVYEWSFYYLGLSQSQAEPTYKTPQNHTKTRSQIIFRSDFPTLTVDNNYITDQTHCTIWEKPNTLFVINYSIFPSPSDFWDKVGNL